MAELSKALEQGGPAEAILKCRDVSPELEKKLSANGLRVRRVSLRNRNPQHAPDAFERTALEAWQKNLDVGEQVLKPVTQRTADGYRVVQAIRIPGPQCLKCHGTLGEPEEIDAATSEKLKALYPQDKATGYRLGDLRGAFSVIWMDERKERPE